MFDCITSNNTTFDPNHKCYANLFIEIVSHRIKLFKGNETNIIFRSYQDFCTKFLLDLST